MRRAGARTKRLRIGRWATSCRSISLRLRGDRHRRQMLGGHELGLVPGIIRIIFAFGLDYGSANADLEFVDYMRAAFGETQPFSYHGRSSHDNADFRDAGQQPHPPLWHDVSRSARSNSGQNGHSIRAISWSIARRSRPRYGKFCTMAATLARKANMPLFDHLCSTTPTETDQKAIRASRPMRLFWAAAGETFRKRAAARQNVAPRQPAPEI